MDKEQGKKRRTASVKNAIRNGASEHVSDF
jgi:hypothetical protein